MAARFQAASVAVEASTGSREETGERAASASAAVHTEG